MKTKEKITLITPLTQKPRNPAIDVLKTKRGGAHRKTEAAQRRAEKMAVNKLVNAPPKIGEADN